ncbi:MAG: DUF1749 domain-containing protein [Patescibacteria group bacterium]|jgi:hypothetical protein
MKGELVKVITADGLELKGFFSDQKSDVAVFHSHGTAGDFYTHEFVEVEGNKLAKEKISFLTANNRGHDVTTDIRKHKNGKVEWTQVGGGKERFEDCLLDIDAWINFLIKRGVKKIILQSHSLTQKILYYQYKKSNKKVVGQIHLSPCNDAGLMQSILGEKKYIETNKMIAKIIKMRKDKTKLPDELSVVCQMNALAYSGYLVEEGEGNLFPYHNTQSKKWIVLEKAKEPLLAIFGGADIYIKPSNEIAANLFKLKAKSSKNITTKIIKDASHSYLDFERELVDVIFSWIKDNYL